MCMAKIKIISLCNPSFPSELLAVNYYDVIEASFPWRQFENAWFGYEMKPNKDTWPRSFVKNRTEQIPCRHMTPEIVG